MLAALAAVSLIATQGKLPRAPDAVLPFESADGQMILKVKINGKEAKVSIDTGSEEVRIQPDSAVRLGLVNAAPEIARLVRLTSDQTFEFGPLKFAGVSTKVTPMFVDEAGNATDHQAYDGIIGLSFLRKHGWGIDLRSHQIALWRNGKILEDDAKAWAGPDTVSVRLRTERRSSNRYVIDGFLGGRPVSFLFDTGCSVMLQTPDQAKASGSDATIAIRGQRFLEGTHDVFFGVGPEVRVPWRTLTAPYLVKLNDIAKENLSEIEVRGIAAVIGSETLTDTKSVFDFPGRRLSVSAKSPVNEWKDYLGSFGFRVLFMDGKPIAAVRPGSPADRAGVKNLDLLEMIDGNPVIPTIETTPIPSVMGQPEITLTIRRADKTVKVTMRK